MVIMRVNSEFQKGRKPRESLEFDLHAKEGNVKGNIGLDATPDC